MFFISFKSCTFNDNVLVENYFYTQVRSLASNFNLRKIEFHISILMLTFTRAELSIIFLGNIRKQAKLVL